MTRGELATVDRIYSLVKAELLAGAFRPGERIEAIELAERHAASISPVRAALYRLCGEQLVDARTGEGFHAPLMTEVSLRDLYAWNGQVILLALQLSPPGALDVTEAPQSPDPAASQAENNAEFAARIFAAIGRSSGNGRCAAAIDRLNDHLQLARRLEARMIANVDKELGDIVASLERGARADVRRLIAAYHRRRIRLSAALVGLMHSRNP